MHNIFWHFAEIQLWHNSVHSFLKWMKYRWRNVWVWASVLDCFSLTGHFPLNICVCVSHSMRLYTSDVNSHSLNIFALLLFIANIHWCFTCRIYKRSVSICDEYSWNISRLCSVFFAYSVILEFLEMNCYSKTPEFWSRNRFL